MPNDERLLLLDKHQVEKLLDPDAVLAAVREAFVLHGRGLGRNFPVVRDRLATDGIFGIKSGDVPSEGLLGLKAAGFWPRNRDRAGEPHQATIALFDPNTGRPLCLIDGNAITTMRTGAAGALGLVALAPQDCTDLCIFGTGVQATIQLFYALRVMPSLRMIRYVSSDGHSRPDFEAQFMERCDIACARDPDTAIAASRIVVTATSGNVPLFSADAVQPGTHINCVGTDTKGKRELPEGLLPRSLLFGDDREQARQIGEMQWAAETFCVELGQVLTGKAQFSRSARDVTIFDMTGLSLQDLTVARMVLLAATATGIGSSISWPW
jgi:alanine dehydrogenase